MLVQILLPKWYAAGNIDVAPNDAYFEYEPALETCDGEMCCLGFCARAHGARNFMEIPTPKAIAEDLNPNDWMINRRSSNHVVDSDLAELAMWLNDSAPPFKDMDLPTRMGNLITVFAAGGDALEFINEA
jgi:hypothetical protein